MAATTPSLLLLDVSPFDEKNVHQLGLPNNWPELRRILSPLAVPGFAVVGVWSQALLDGARVLLDSSVGGEPEGNVLQTLVASDVDAGVNCMLEQLLAIGMDPDLDSAEKWRPSHACAFRGHLRATQSLLLCRPDLAAKNVNGDTPLAAALKKNYQGDDEFPHQVAKRQDVAKLIQNEQPFKKLAELALRELWFAVKNLVRRQVIPVSEFEEKSGGKTAAEWADHFGETLMAQEIRYYASLPSAKLLDAEAKNKTLEGEVHRLKEKVAEAEAARAKDKKEAQSMEERYKKKVAELSETVSALTAYRLGEGPSEMADQPRRSKRLRKVRKL